MAEDARGGDPDPRIVLAAERTLLAWIRTGLALMGFGFVVARFGLFLREFAAVMHEAPPSEAIGVSQAVGVMMMGLGVMAQVVAAWQHVRFVRRYNRGELQPWQSPVSAGVVLAVGLAILGGGMAIYLLT